MCLEYKIYEPDAKAHATYNRLFALYRALYFGFGSKHAEPVSLGHVLPELKKIAAEVQAVG